MTADYGGRRSDEVGAANQERVHHEESDVNVRAIFTFVVGLVAVGVVVHLAMWGLMMYFGNREAQASAVREFPLTVGLDPVPPSPRLQETPRLDLENLQALEDEVLSRYGWADKAAGTVRIPIDEAMKLTLQRGLPVRGSTEPAQSADQAKPEDPGR